MRKKVIFWMLTLVMISAASVNAQVIIGGSGTDDPHAGAGLDLSPLGAQNLGLLLPSVALTNDAAEFALVAEATPGQKTDARGMLVYNTADVLDGKGLYLWDGAKWQGIAPAPATPVEDYSTVIDADGNTYSAAKFGDAGWWMTQNLRTTHYTDASDGNSLKKLPIKNDNANANSPYYHYPSGIYTSADAPEGYKDEYGLLYTWAAANIGTEPTDSEQFSGTASTRQGICPSGWHLPSDYEWTQLTDVISASADGTYSETEETGSAGKKMKSSTKVAATSQFPNPNDPQGTSNVKDANGFAALLVGNMYSGSSNNYGTYTYFWSSSSTSSADTWYWTLHYSITGVNHHNYHKTNMYSVRCKKN